MTETVFAGSSRSLAQGLSQLREEGLFCDVFFAAEGLDQQPPCRWVPAHQVVLAASNTGFRSKLANGAHEDPESCDKKMVHLRGVRRPEAVEAAVTAAYGLGQSSSTPAECRDDLRLLAQGLNLPSLASAGPGRTKASGQGAKEAAAAELARELQSMRKRGHLCDLTLRVGDAQFQAHQAVLAAASPGLKKHLVSQMAPVEAEPEEEQPFQATEGRQAAAASELPDCETTQPLELDLEGITHHEAVLSMLDHVYGEEGSLAFLPQTRAALQDLVKLAEAFELPMLRNAAAEKLAAEAERRDSIGRSSRGGSSPSDKAATASSDAASAREPETVKCVRFSEVSEVPDAAPGLPKMVPRESKILERLFDAFDERPLWLEGPLSARLPASATSDMKVLERFLPYVCYQWVDGPWKNAYCRLGYDPRAEDQQDAKWLQVINFRDPHFKPPAASDASAGTVLDHTFRRPPTLKNQQYQLIDIRDDFVHSIVTGADGLDACDKKAGWLPPVMLEAVVYRLQLKSLELRERNANKGKQQQARGRQRQSTQGGGRAKVARVGGA